MHKGLVKLGKGNLSRKKTRMLFRPPSAMARLGSCTALIESPCCCLPAQSHANIQGFGPAQASNLISSFDCQFCLARVALSQFVLPFYWRFC